MGCKDAEASDGIGLVPLDLRPGAPVRIVLVSTPRSGNNWLRHLLARLYDVPSLAIHNPADIDWAALPPQCVVGIHWYPTRPFLQLLQGHGFCAVVLARQPLDVLVSVLHFALHSPTARWLEGEGGDERAIYGAMPRSSVFLQYAAGKRATALLGVTCAWWEVPGCRRVRYEELVADPRTALGQLVDDLGMAIRKSVDAALAETTIPKLRTLTSCPHHFWQGRPGLWKSLLPAPEAHTIAQAQPASFSAPGYTCAPDPDLEGFQADANWIELVGAELAGELQNLGPLKQQLETSQELVQALQTKLAASQQALEEATNQWKNIGPMARSVADRLHRLALRYPRTARMVKQLFR